MFLRKGVLKIGSKFTGEHPSQSVKWFVKLFQMVQQLIKIFQKTQLSNIAQLGGFVYSDCLADLFPPSKMINSVANLFEK